MRVYVCHNPSGEAAVQENWSIGAANRVNWMYAEDTCANNDQGYLSAALGANPSGFAAFPDEPYIYWTYTTPGWADIASFDLEVSGIYAYPAPNGGGIGTANVDDSEKTDPSYDLRDLGGGTWNATKVTDEAKGTMTSIQILAGCDGGNGPCPASTPIANIDVTAGNIVLNDLTSPTASNISGPLSAPGEITGTSEITLHATDQNGPGIYSASLEIDNTRQPAINIGGGSEDPDSLCRDLQPTSTIPAFDSTQPCPRQTDGTLQLNTATVPDGKHTLKLYVQDAAGSTTLAWAGTIQTNNAPFITTSPTITGPAQVGSVLFATHGTYLAPPGAGTMSSITGQWSRCTDEQAAHCSAITGATSQTYTPNTADTGYRLLYQETISDTDGTTTANSAPTIPVTPQNETCPPDCPPGGRSTTTSSSSTNGTPTITINQPSQAHSPSHTPWRILLNVKPTSAHKHTRITISGKVTTRPLPPHGKLVELRARTLHTHTITKDGKHRTLRTYGTWKVFALLKTKTDGHFQFWYALKQAGKHTYQIQAVAPTEDDRTAPTGFSNTLLVHES